MLVDNTSVQQTWRRWLRGPKHGTARGMAVYGRRSFRHDHNQVTSLLGDCVRLRDWARSHQLDLDDRPGSLAALDQALRARPEEAVTVLNADGGLYLGTVMVQNLPNARWRIWPNGHPVVQLASGWTLDVVALAGQQAATAESHLADLYADAARFSV